PRAIQHSEREGERAQKHRDGRMPPALSSSIRMPAIQLLGDESSDIWQSGQQRNLQVALSREAFQNGGEPESDAVTSGHGTEIAQCQQDYIPVAQSSPNTQRMMTIILGLF